MAFTSTEKARIRLLGGWGSRWTQTRTRLESSMIAIEDNLPAEEELIRSLLLKLDGLEIMITDASGMIGVKQTGSIILDDSAGMWGLRMEARRIVEAIYQILECDILKNYYAYGFPCGGLIQYG